MKFTIRSKYNDSVMFEIEADSFIKAVESKKANLRGADLYGADLREADLYGANLREADLYGANLREANLRGANLYGADLYGANLYGANLYGADLRGANLRGANLRGADLRGADLYGADLRGADLKWTVISSKYICHLSEDKNGVTLIRIGCECLPVAKWEKQKDALADKHDREWWNESGQYIYEFLKAEAERYDKQKGA
jgi:hypothetical protein